LNQQQLQLEAEGAGVAVLSDPALLRRRLAPELLPVIPQECRAELREVQWNYLVQAAACACQGLEHR
jgi:hypothetical protein